MIMGHKGIVGMGREIVCKHSVNTKGRTLMLFDVSISRFGRAYVLRLIRGEWGCPGLQQGEI